MAIMRGIPRNYGDYATKYGDYAMNYHGQWRLRNELSWTMAITQRTIMDYGDYAMNYGDYATKYGDYATNYHGQWRLRNELSWNMAITQ